MNKTHHNSMTVCIHGSHSPAISGGGTYDGMIMCFVPLTQPMKESHYLVHSDLVKDAVLST